MSSRNSVSLNNRRASLSSGGGGGGGGGTKPVPNESSISEVIILVILNLLKRLLFLNVRYRLQTYFCLLFFLSLIVDFGPKLSAGSNFSSRDSFLNVYFAKLAWFWNLLVLVPFVTLTSMLISNQYKFCWKNPIVRYHLSRIAIATCFWYTMTSAFVYFDHIYGKCSIEQGNQSKQHCRQSNGSWISLDISGHAFIFIYGSLVLIEESRAFLGWDHIQIELLNEQYNRSKSQTLRSNPLRKLNDRDFVAFANHYRTYRIPVRVLFVLIVCLQLLWDLMLLTTILYHHRMIEKLLGGLIAVSCWFGSYRVWFASGYFCPHSPGSDILTFQQQKTVF